LFPSTARFASQSGARVKSRFLSGTGTFVATFVECVSDEVRCHDRDKELIMGFGRGILLWLLGVPLPIIILLALFWHH
jgi:hypothetical protein